MTHVTTFGSYRDRVKKAWKFRFNRPNHDLGLYWGLVFRIGVGIFSGLSAFVFVLALGILNGFAFSTLHVVSIGIILGLMTLLGEYYRSRLFETARKSENEMVEMTISSGAIQIDGLPAFGDVKRSNPMFGRFLKRTFDIVVSSFALFALFPLMLTIAIAIRSTSAGPIFSASERQGLNGRKFRLLRFRSMRIDANVTSSAPADAQDQRVTPVGRFIRSTSIDELPQLVNVLRGDMSFVGHSPPAQNSDGYGFDPVLPGSKPGLVSLSSSLGLRPYIPEHGEQIQSIEQLYVENWSLLADFQIIGRVLVMAFWHATD